MMKKTRIANKIAEDAMNRLDELAVLCYYDTDFNPVFDKQMYGQLIVKECAWLVRQETLKNFIEHDNEYLENQWRMQQQVVSNHAINAYQWALDNGIAKEQARAVMPEGITMSKLYMNGTMRSWIHYIQLRSANGTQKEHREIAIECANIIEPIFPMIKEFIEQ